MQSQCKKTNTKAKIIFTLTEMERYNKLHTSPTYIYLLALGFFCWFSYVDLLLEAGWLLLNRCPDCLKYTHMKPTNYLYSYQGIWGKRGYKQALCGCADHLTTHCLPKVRFLRQRKFIRWPDTNKLLGGYDSNNNLIRSADAQTAYHNFSWIILFATKYDIVMSSN